MPDTTETVDTDLNGIVHYNVPVIVEIRDGDIWSVRVMDEVVTLDPSEDTTDPLVEAAESNEWPSWEFG